MPLIKNRTITVDAGSSYIRTGDGTNILFEEPNRLEVDNNGRVVGYGDSVDPFSNNPVLKPVKFVISDFHAFEMILRTVIKNHHLNKKWSFRKDIIFFSIPTDLTEVEKRAYRDSGEHAGGVEIYMINNTTCISASLGLLEKVNQYFIVDFSDSKFQISAFSNRSEIATATIHIGISHLKNCINESIKTSKKLNANEIQEVLKKFPLSNSRNDITPLIEEAITSFISVLKPTITECTEGPNKSLIKYPDSYPIYVSGNGANYKGLATEILSSLNTNIIFSESPYTDNIKGLNIIASEPILYQEYMKT